jgi:hypothetical protein
MYLSSQVFFLFLRAEQSRLLQTVEWSDARLGILGMLGILLLAYDGQLRRPK